MSLIRRREYDQEWQNSELHGYYNSEYLWGPGSFSASHDETCEAL